MAGGAFQCSGEYGQKYEIIYTLVCRMSGVHSEWNKDLCQEVNG